MAVKYWEAKPLLYKFSYDTGTHSPVVGETINVDVEAAETAVVAAWTNTDGWGGAGYGTMWVYSCSATFITNLENNDNIDDSGDTQICITTGGVTEVAGHSDEAGNWGTGENPTVPVAADEVIFDARSSTSVSDGIAVGETGGVDFDLLHVKKGSTIDIGTDSERLHTSAQKIIIEGSGTYYIEVSEDATGKDQVIPLIIINNKSATVYLTSNQNDGSWCCEFTTVLVLAGTVYIGDSNIDTAVQYLRISPRHNKHANATVTIHEDCERYKATTYKMTIHMENGICTMDSGAALIEMNSGTFTYGSDLEDSPETGLDIATLRLHGGTFTWRPDDSDDDAEITNVWLFGGTLSASGTTNNNRTKYLGGGAGEDIHLFEGATLNIANGMGNIEITTGAQLWNFGGTLKVDNYTQIAVDYDIP